MLMKKDDVQLIRNVLSGDDESFNLLVRKYQKDVHALVWRKVQDFHYAEEITQDTFLQAYRKLGTLKNPKQFAGWLYVIANRLCLNWLERHKPKMQSLEDISVVEIEKSSYENYISDQREAEAADRRTEIVKKLLGELPESERTVVTLHYLGEMTAKEIGKFLGVSVNTIKSRLRRGRERLQAAESLVQDVLGGIQLSPHLAERIMRHIADINPTVPPTGRPLIPWMAFGAAAILVMLMLGMSNQYLVRFQRPYSFEARSEPTIEIVDAPIVLDVISEPAIRNQLGRAALPGERIGAGTQISEVTLRSNSQEDRLNFSTEQWTQTNGPPAGHVRDIFAAPAGTLYAVAPTGMYRLAADAPAWSRVNANIPTGDSLMPMAENRGTLYIVSADEIFASTDDGQTWNTFCSRPKGYAIGLIIAAEAEKQNSQADMTIYLALRDEGVFRSTDNGTRWEPFNDGLTAERISAIAAVEKTVFIGTNHGLYRLDSGVWKKLPVGTSKAVYSMTVLESNLYVGMGPDLFGLTPADVRSIAQNQETGSGQIFRSSDVGASWTNITPKDISRLGGMPAGIKVLAVGKTLLALGATEFRSTDNGETWTNLGRDENSFMLNSVPAVAVNEKTFYKVGGFGIHRTTDGGDSWHLFMPGVVGTRVKDLVVFNNRLYAYTGDEVFRSTDERASWKTVGFDSEDGTLKLKTGPSFVSKLVVADNCLYFLSPIKGSLQIVRLATDGSRFIPIHNVPAFNEELSALPEFTLHPSEKRVKVKTLAVNRDVFYAEYKRRLFKWKLGDPKWTNTGLVDTGERSDKDFKKGFRIAVSGETVYVGKRDGKLFQSSDGGNNWRDVTSNLPLHFTSFKEIVFVGASVYVATDKGVLVSHTGERWHAITDRTDTRIVIDQFAMEGTAIYGLGDMGIYRLNPHGRWEQFSSEAPGEVTSLAIVNNRLYSTTQQRGIFHISLAQESLRTAQTQQ